MNKDYVLWNLREAQEALAEIIAGVESDPEYEPGGYIVDLTHLYHHVNTAWNARNATKAATDECSQEDFLRWRQFPTEDVYLGD
jgi:hypothetical protein